MHKCCCNRTNDRGEQSKWKRAGGVGEAIHETGRGEARVWHVQVQMKKEGKEEMCDTLEDAQVLELNKFFECETAAPLSARPKRDDA